MTSPRRAARGFTLVEVLATMIVVVAILTSVTALMGGAVRARASGMEAAVARAQLEKAMLILTPQKLRPGRVVGNGMVVTVRVRDGQRPANNMGLADVEIWTDAPNAKRILKTVRLVSLR